MVPRNLLHVGVLGLALLVGAGALMSHAHPNRGLHAVAEAPGSIGVVDMERIYDASDMPNLLAQQAAALQAQANDRLNTIAGAKYLDVKELDEYGALVAKANPDAAQQARMKELKALSDNRDNELQTLKATPDAALTPQQKSRMRALVEQSHVIDKILPALQRDLQADFSERVQNIRHNQNAQLRTTVAQIAREKGIEHVFDSNALVYSANDLTQAVLQKIKKRGGP
jgi:Skp family chaperone for outer membrane proteins